MKPENMKIGMPVMIKNNSSHPINGHPAAGEVGTLIGRIAPKSNLWFVQLDECVEIVLPVNVRKHSVTSTVSIVK